MASGSKPPSALKHNGLKWKNIPTSAQDATFASLSKYCLLTEDQLKTYCFPSLSNSPYPQSDVKTKQEHLYLKEHCSTCGQSSTSSSKFCKNNLHTHKHTFTTTYDGLTRTYTATPASNPNAPRAVVLSTIKVDLAYGKEAIVKISVVDFLTGRILLDSLVCPSEEDGMVVDWKTKTSMIDAGVMKKAQKEGRAFMGVEKAREKVLEVVGRETIVVGFDLRGDLEALRVAHGNVADYKVLYDIHFPGFSATGSLPLQDVFRAYCDSQRFSYRERHLVFRAHGAKKTGWDCLEDVMGAREIILHWMEKKGRRMGIYKDVDSMLEASRENDICYEEWAEHGLHSDMFGDRKDSIHQWIDDHDEYLRS